ncbi:hypothetical protein K458DRAFT_413623 [Lentithecium fluviatile CBS 122367]|uniref:Uncharacterized protein n=1 Tax=Lentithecium fluviatile CBS 122367 TaxID=1168545 RepID=A0A6G1JFV5_9PLEO|nr:hypothetical protein K458DRAFT_413623 [Lentithecium fluviatile CBS 122367]
MAEMSDQIGEKLVPVGDESAGTQEVDMGTEWVSGLKKEEGADGTEIKGDAQVKDSEVNSGTKESGVKKEEGTHDVEVKNDAQIPGSTGTGDKQIATGAADAVDTMDYQITDVDNRLTYRRGWPLLPVLPVLTFRSNVPLALSPSRTHMKVFREILEDHSVTIHSLEVAHRYNAGSPISKRTLTLCVLSEEKDNTEWPEAIRALRTYIETEDPPLTLAIEIIDHRIFHGLHTLPILPHEKRLSSAIKKRKHGVVNILEESGLRWTSLEFWWRGFSGKREDCKPTVLIGTGESQKKAWWKDVKEQVEEKMGSKWVAEICHREVTKY